MTDVGPELAAMEAMDLAALLLPQPQPLARELREPRPARVDADRRARKIESHRLVACGALDRVVRFTAAKPQPHRNIAGELRPARRARLMVPTPNVAPSGLCTSNPRGCPKRVFRCQRCGERWREVRTTVFMDVYLRHPILPMLALRDRSRFAPDFLVGFWAIVSALGKGADEAKSIRCEVAAWRPVIVSQAGFRGPGGALRESRQGHLPGAPRDEFRNWIIAVRMQTRVRKKEVYGSSRATILWSDPRRSLSEGTSQVR